MSGVSVKSFLTDAVGITQLRDSHKMLGAGKFWTVMSATLTYIAIGSTLSIMAIWPGNCDHVGRRLTGFVKQFSCSPDLLSGGAVEIGLFVWLWSLPAIVVITVAWSWINHFQRKRSNDSVE